MHNYLKVLVLLLTVTFSSLAWGQLNFKKGYIITNENDTVYGLINDGGGYRNSKICLFKQSHKKVVKYHPGEIKAYRMVNDKYYASKEIEIKDTLKAVFLEVVVRGKVNLYHYWKNKTLAFYIEKDNNLVGLFNEVGLLTYNSVDETILLYGAVRDVVVRNREYLDSLRAVFKDSKPIVDRIEEVHYKETELANITRDYILEKCKGDNCIIYERDHKIYKPTMGIYSGVRFNQFEFYSNYNSETVKSDVFTSNPIGVFFNFPMHLINDNLSFQVEILSNQMSYQQDFGAGKGFLSHSNYTIKNNTIGVPLLIKYEIGNHKIRPTIAVGKEIGYGYQSDVTIDQQADLKIHPTQKGNWLGQLGLNYKMAKRFTVFADLRLQKNDNLIIEKQFQSTPYKTLIEKENIKRKYTNLSSAVLIGIEF